MVEQETGVRPSPEALGTTMGAGGRVQDTNERSGLHGNP